MLNQKHLRMAALGLFIAALIAGMISRNPEAGTPALAAGYILFGLSLCVERKGKSNE